MLSKKSEQFLNSVRMELMKRGKKDEDIEAVTDELRDHLTQAEKRGKSVESITGGSPDAYIDSISKEMPFDHSFIKTMIGALFAILAFFTIPRLVAGQFEMSVERLIFYGLLIVILLPLEFWLLMTMLKKYGHTRQGYFAPLLIAFLGFAVILAGEFYLRANEGASIINLDMHMSLWLGLILLLLFIGFCAMHKAWFYIGVMVYLVLPDLIARILTDQPAGSKEFVNISSSIFLMLSVVALVGAMAFYSRFKKNSH